MSRECFKVSNNKYFNCPALMSDGRTFTDYRSSCVVDQNILHQNKIKSSYEYRQFLINNASNFMNKNNELNNKKNSCETCNATPIPLKTICEVDGYTSICKMNDDGGLGLGTVASNMPLLNYAPALEVKKFDTDLSKPTNFCNKVVMN